MDSHPATSEAFTGQRMQNKSPPLTFDYRELFERAPFGYVLLDASGRICKINSTGAAMLGWKPAWLTGESLARWVVGADKQLFQAHLSKLGSAGGCINQKLRVKNRQGRIATLWLKSDREPNIYGHIEHFRSVMIDVSGEQASALKLRSLQSQLTRLARQNTAGELVSSLAHELNQPLGTVVLCCEAASRLLNAGATQSPDFVKAVTQAQDAARFASEIVRHLRGFLQNDSDEMFCDCEFSTLLQDVTMLIEVAARDSDIELQLDIEQGLPCVRVDAVQIGQVLVNLAHNSIEAMREMSGLNHRLCIKARQLPAGSVQVSVIDTGPGLDRQQVDSIFKPFYTTKNKGMGLGLSISRTIIEAHGGKLWAEPTHITGAMVHFTLPTVQGDDHDD
ncbi:two-component system, LuxR family, sensor kinase FixL [Pseudomonas sp. IT-P253]